MAAKKKTLKLTKTQQALMDRLVTKGGTATVKDLRDPENPSEYSGSVAAGRVVNTMVKLKLVKRAPAKGLWKDHRTEDIVTVLPPK